MKDRGLALRCALVAIWFLFVAVDSLARTETVNGITWTYSVSGGEAIIGGYIDGNASVAVPTSTQGAVVIPSTLGNYPVGKIAAEAFLGCSKLTSVTIPNGVTSIGYGAFRDCSGLTSVTIPDSVTSIGYSAFNDCSGLTSVTIPNSVTNIGDCAFRNCSRLASLEIPDGVTSIGSQAFDGCRGLTSVSIPNSVTSICATAFYGCSGLKDVHITDIAAWCRIYFRPHTDDSNRWMLPSGHNLYVNGELLVNLVVPDGVTSIGGYAFYNYTNLKSVTIPSSVTSIGKRAFSGCRGLTGVYISDVAEWCGITFSSPDANPLSLTHELHSNGELLVNLVVPDGVTSIGHYAFYNCTNLTNVIIPNSVTNIGLQAFCNCTNLTSVTIPNSVTSIGSGAFSGCNGLTNVTIPSRWALSDVFANSYTKILSVNVPSGSTSVVNGAFKGCIALEDVSIPDTVTSIGDEAFYNCSALQQLTLPDGVTSYGVNCFEGCPAYTRALYRALFSGSSGGGSPVVVTTVVQQVEAPYALSSAAADRAIASVVVSSDCSIGSFVLKDGKVYDTMLYVSNTADHEVSLSLPSGYSYKTIKGATPLTIPASSQCIISITRVDANTFLVMREELDDVK